MHSSRMRTGRSLTVCCRLLPRGRGVCSQVVSAPGGCLLWGGVSRGVSAPGGRGCLLWGLSAPGWGVSALGGVCSWMGGCLLPGAAPWGLCSRGVSAWGGVCSEAWSLLREGVCIPACTETDTPLLTELQTPVKT